MEGGQQLRLLLWKDYLIRKRKLITIVGIIWATLVMLSLYIVRINVDNVDYPTCTYPARALPSAGMLPFLQSFMCTINNECSPLDLYDEIPFYEKSKLTQLQRTLAPVLNDTVLDVASSVPDAIKLLATLADVVDEPAFIEISKNGLKIKDLFEKPSRVRRYVSDKLHISDDVTRSIMNAELSLQGIMKGNIDRCSTASLEETIVMENHDHMIILKEKLCSMSMEELQKMFIDILFQVNYSKYVTMLGDMYYKMSGDKRLNAIGNMLTAVLRMMRLQNFLPRELVSIFQGQDSDFSYMKLTLISKLMDLFKPTFGDTQSFAIINGFSDAIVVGLQYMDKVFAKQRNSSIEVTNNNETKNGLQAISDVFHNAAEVFEEDMQKDSSIDAFSVLTQIMNFITKFLPANTKHDVLFYSTLLAKLMESAQKVVDINMNIEHLTYNVTLRHPGAVDILKELPPVVVGKAFEALADAERTQILTSKINLPGQMFCDTYKLQTFFVVSKTEAESLKKQLCTDVWKNYVSDLVKSFGVFEVKNNINNMASLLIQETLGKDTNDQLYTIEQDFKILQNFTQALVSIQSEHRQPVDWNSLFHVQEDSEVMKAVRAKSHLGKQILIVIHGAIAKEIVHQNPILDFKISPYLNDVIILVSAINEQLEKSSESQAKAFKEVYADVVVALLTTALNEEKTYKALSSNGVDMFCNGVEIADAYLILPLEDDKKKKIITSLCDATVAIENGLEADSVVSKAIQTIMNSAHPVVTLNWNKLINNLKNLYTKLDRDYPYLFQFQTYNIDNSTKKQVNSLFAEAKEYWFGVKNMERSLRLSFKFAFRFLDILDYGLFNMNSQFWLRMKYIITRIVGPMKVFDETVRLVAALLTNDTYTSDLPPATVAALEHIIPNIPQLTVDAVNIIKNNDTDVQAVISLLNSDPPWPCSTSSLGKLLALTPTSMEAVVGMETIMCMNKQFQDEWIAYLDSKNVSLSNFTTWNTTDYRPHLFLEFSSSFDSLMEDIVISRKALQDAFSGTANGRLGLKDAWDYAVKTLNTTDRDEIMRSMFTKIDTVLNTLNTSSIPSNVSMNNLFERYTKCIMNGMDDDCRLLGRKAWQNFFESFSIILENIATDLLTYFREANEPNSNILQMLGFTRSTGLYILYDKMPEFMAVLLNSYWDYGFMSQVRRATLSQFWDCDAVLSSMVAPPGSVIDSTFMNKVKPFVCPSLLHWISLPRGDNTLLDVFAKPQYFFFTLPVSNLTSRFEKAYTKATELTNYLTEISKKNQTLLTEEDVKMNSIEGKLKKVVDAVVTFKIDENNPSYRLFNEINLKQFAANVYLTRIVSIINKLSTELTNLNITEVVTGTDEEIKAAAADLQLIKYLFRRKPTDAINIHFDIITDVIWANDENYTLVDAFDKMCKNLNTNASKSILVSDDDKARGQICAKRYNIIYSAVQNIAVPDYNDTRQTLLHVVDILKTDNETVTDVFEFLSHRKQLITSLKTSTKHAYDLSIPIYLKYLHSNIQSYNVILGFLTGENWWHLLTDLYNGPYATKFFGYLENSFEVAEDLLSNFDDIHVIRLLHDIDVNQTEWVCLPNITLSDYIPDKTGLWSDLKEQICNVDKAELYKEIPPLLFASQGYESSLRLPKNIDNDEIDSDISEIESKLDIIRDGPKSPQNPPWVTDEKVEHFRKVALGLLSKETLTKISFAILSNGVDAGTLFLNNSQCTVCSQFTTWFKQLNLQLFKKQEYDNLLCHLNTMSLEDVYHALKNDFHWDMAIKELISTRNYTKYEMNKSMNEFLGQVKLHLLEDISTTNTKVTECLAKNVSRNEFGNATIFASVLAQTGKLLRAELPHIHEVDGIKSLPYLKVLSSEVAHNIDVVKPLKDYLMDKSDLHGELMKIVDDHDIVADIENAQVNLRKIRSISEPDTANIVIKPARNWTDLCARYNCSNIAAAIRNNINNTLIEKALPKYQDEEFWRFNFVSNIIQHLEDFMSHSARLLGLASKVNVKGVMDGNLEAMVDALLLVISDESLDNIMFSLQGILEQLHPLLEGTPLDQDLSALASGLHVVRQLKNYLLEDVNLNVEVSKLFPDADDVEVGLSALGINNTNFWSVAAPRIHAGTIQLKPLFSSKPDDSHIAKYVCQMDHMSKVLFPANLDVVSAEDVFGATIEQFCGLPDHIAKQVLPVLLRNFNYSLLLDEVASTLLTKLYSASNLTKEEGSRVLEKFSQMAALIPVIQEKMEDVTLTLANETLFQSLRDFSSIGNLFSSPDFMSSAGKLLCGKPFQVNTNKFYKSIAATKDFSTEPDQAQLNVLPTDYCRSLYVDIINMEGGKIMWSFVKPLIMGKILYTPPTPTVTRIIEQANSTFATMIKMTGLVHSFSASFPAIDKLSSHREGVAVLRRIMTAPQFSSIRKMLIKGDEEISVPDVDIDSLFAEFGDLNSIGSLLSKMSNLLQCINLNRFQPSSNEQNMTYEAAQLSIVNEFSAGLVFLDSQHYDGALNKVEYKIRMDIDNAPTTARLKDYLWVPGPEANFLENMRYFRGFIQIQDIVDKAIIKLSHNSTHRRKRETQQEMDWAVYTQQMPYPCYRKDFFQSSLYESQSMIVAFFFSLLFTVASAVRFIVIDKETGNTMLMSVMGVDLRWHTLSWFLTSFVEMTVTNLCITMVLHFGQVLPRTDPTLIFTLIFIFGIAVLSFCYMLSKMFKSASLAAVFSAIVYLMTFMPIVIILSLETFIGFTLKFLVCLFMSSSLSYSFLYIARFEARGSGASWADVWGSPSGPDDTNIAFTAGMMVLDAILYFIIGWLVDRYCGIKTLTTNITHCTTTDEKAGVSIVNITKVYEEGSRRAKVALDNVSIELHKGQITTLLGHNGAGKTTLINILMGMLKPSRGHVVVRGARAGTRLGVCPQHDVLVDGLTAREHVQLYAQLKSGRSADEVRDEVDKMLEVLSLGPVCDEPVHRLSGGTRRRLCVALAFVGQPHLVSLDEPTSGVDPAARRDIWSMIVKLKEDRTILLTTHHLDEAELLSDQIVIMHKGQIHTTGSPIEIKRTLGNGYKLTVMYPVPDIDHEETWEDTSQEEKTKQLLTVVRDVVKNANVVDVSGNEVEIALPFFDSNGLNNNFLQLCTVLEATQSALGFKTYTLDCSSLEQVFFNICQQADSPQNGIEYVIDGCPSKSASSSSIRTDRAQQDLVPPDGPLKGTTWQQFKALMYARYMHHIRNWWLMFLLMVLPTVFVSVAMAFSMLRPPADNEIALKLDDHLYKDSTEFLVPPPVPSQYVDPKFVDSIVHYLMMDKQTKNWTRADNPRCECRETRQHCNITEAQSTTPPELMLLPDSIALNKWLVGTQEIYIEKRYGGFSMTLKNNMTNMISWYNNKGHHAMPAYLNTANNAILRAVSGKPTANITTYTHPLKISNEPISKATVYQHIADAGISGLVLVAYCLVSAGAAIYLVGARRSQEKRLQLLCGVSPLLYWTTALVWDMMIMAINVGVTAIVMTAFGFPVFVARNNLPAICILLMLYGFACGSMVHLFEKIFSEPSMANMVLFCGNAFIGLTFIAILLIFDIISESEETDYARYVLHKFFMLAPQFALGDGLLEIAKNTIQAEVLNRFGMDTYKDPFSSTLVAYHCVYLLVVGTVLQLLNLAVEYNCFDTLLARLRSERVPAAAGGELEAREVSDERRRVLAARRHAHSAPLRVNTIGNINRGYIHTEGKKGSLQRVVAPSSDAAQCVELSKCYPAFRGYNVALRNLTLGIPPGQCTALLGQNGAGKSTTFSMLTGEVRPTSGQLYLNNKLVNSTQLCRNGLISYCPQSDAIDRLLTVSETLRFYCKLRGIDDQEEVIKRTMEVFDLTKYSEVLNGTLSGGNKRKLCTAIAFMARTPLVLLDEPTSGMDPVSRGCVSRGVRAACGRARGVLLATHALHDARRLAARVALLRHGHLVALAPLEDCLNRFGGGYVVQCRVGRGGASTPRSAWRGVTSRAPHAQLRVLHQHTLHFLVPTHCTVDQKEVTTRLSDIFRLMAELQSTCDIEDFTVNQSSLEQMFLSFTDKSEIESDIVEVEQLPSPDTIMTTEELDTVTAL
ncbi:unnamed protein product [Spodoptera littoralis]|uniref:ABC transporter domain-containing protein n=2 Tax=Spodoptera TaxID=7106 RepID=A0A9P0HSV8_SPOLI|nr:unnamed protein product [Spodoptera littoralis]CAH1634658.1 unnamed protein product [Spodoptera littoralis]